LGRNVATATTTQRKQPRHEAAVRGRAAMRQLSEENPTFRDAAEAEIVPATTSA
jgi:hypothetical protein